ncbi:unnamed protein product [Allacma fusca]|uniref:Uncharacterized protein n=1 Tax=Allacma fusca TaxID=39272 RepID=A0A8J2PQ39_9HEXA|nr:unnamed protein product [Allacma fusca]
MEEIRTCLPSTSCKACISMGYKALKLTNDTICCAKTIINLDVTFNGVVDNIHDCPTSPSSQMILAILIAAILTIILICVTFQVLKFLKLRNRNEQLESLTIRKSNRNGSISNCAFEIELNETTIAVTQVINKCN